MKLKALLFFPLLAGFMALWMTLSQARAGDLPASDYAPRSGKLTAQEMTMARNAWQYFVANYQPTTGLVNAVNKYPPTHHVGQRLLPCCADGGTRIGDYRQSGV